jgi:cytochrome c peroxidase
MACRTLRNGVFPIAGWLGAIIPLFLACGAPALAAVLSAEQQLGKSLFFDSGLSHGGNQSCASCHNPSAAFTDPDKLHATSKGDNPLLFGNRNSPSAMYMAYSPDFHFDTEEGLYLGGQFTDGRAPTLEEQAKAPFLNPVEMGNASRAEVVDHLKGGSNATAFKAIYGDNAFDDVDGAYSNISKAIAAYERSPELSPFSSKYDFYLRRQASLTQQEQRGLDAFNDPMKGNCAACHISTPGADGTPPLFTDFSYDNIGIPKNVASDFLTLPPEYNPDGVAFLDPGLGGVVGDPSLYGAFKVTTLRNLDLTGPYGHNGYFNTIEQLITFYATRDVRPACADPGTGAALAMALGCWPTAEFASTMNLEELGNLPLNGRDIADIRAFLGTLTDGYSVPEPHMWAMMILGFGLIGGQMRSRRTHLRASA